MATRAKGILMGLLFRKLKDNAPRPAGRRVRFLLWDAVFFGIIGLFVVLFILPRENAPQDPSGRTGTSAPEQRPRMKPGKPKVQWFSKPKPSSRIMSRITTEALPEIKLPDLASAGEGLLGDRRLSYELSAPLESFHDSLFGSTMGNGNELEATFYSLDRGRDGSSRNISHGEYFERLRRFVSSDWDTGRLDQLYRSPRKRYATTVAIPLGSSIAGPLAFDEDIEQCRYWAVHYRGKIVHRDGITFRFWGTSDAVLAVGVDRELVLVANYPWNGMDAYTVGDSWSRRAWNSRSLLQNNGPYKCGDNSLVGGQWITLEPGISHDLDIIVGNGPSSEFFAMLMIEVRDESYPLNDYGGPMFPLFALSPLSWKLQDQILINLFDGEASVTNITTYFNDF